MTDNAYSDPAAGMMDNAYSDSAAEWVRADSLRPWTRNPRRNDAAAQDVARSLIRFGFGAPIVARAGGEIIGGHTRLKAVAMLPGLYRKATVAERETWSPDAVQLATAEHPLVPVRMMDLTEQRAHELALVDNKLGELAEWDDDTLRELMDSIPLADAGFTESEIAELLVDDDDIDWSSMTGEKARPSADRVSVVFCVAVSVAASAEIEEAILRFTEPGMDRADALLAALRSA